MLCPSCGTENPEQARFCLECATPLSAQTIDRRTERKVVSVLFCDLAGFTSRSENADPEDVLATVRPYHALLRDEIESHGGTVEKFIGDAVMAVFGAPVAHEDDAERAVRAALQILRSIDEFNEAENHDLSVRIGVNTGEAVVALGARPHQGEGMVTGDVVNTAARLQTGAPVGAIAVGEGTYHSTKSVFDYEALEPIAAKGKSEPVPAWRALTARARFGTDASRSYSTPLVGRDAERTLLQSLFDRAARDRSCQLVTIGGEPGVGKTRMVFELFSYIQGRPEPVTWLQGRCIPYGDGITFWALGEIVKAHTGILESDSLEQAAVKLDRALRASNTLDPDEIEWFKARLSPLVGTESQTPADREESFTAWGRFLEGVASSNPAVFVFEDLHWADPAMLEFLEHLADWSEGVSMLLVCTTRPELLGRNPKWAGGIRNATSLNLVPLSETETAQLIAGLLEQAVLPAEVQAPILERTGGNPLYAEEFIRMLKDRDHLVRRGRSWELVAGEQLPFPESLQGLIAARLDTLAPSHKELLQDAAVIGKVFWLGAVASMGRRDEREVREALHELTRKEFVRASRASSIEGESEYGFWHMLVRDVAYSQIPRLARIDKHRAAAEWIEGRAGERAEDVADVLAYHYLEALELARAAGGDAAELEERALRFLSLAGDRAANLDPARAQTMYEQALDLAPPGDPARPGILLGLADVLRLMNRYARSRGLLESAIPGFLEIGEPARAAEAKVLLSEVRYLERSPGDLEALDEAISTLENLPPGTGLAAAYAQRANRDYVAGLDDSAIDWAKKAISLSDRLDQPVDTAALRVLGAARCFAGDLSGLEDLRKSAELARERGLTREAVFAQNELANVLAVSTGSADALRELDAGLELARRNGLPSVADEFESLSRHEFLYHCGRWDELVDTTSRFVVPDADDIPAIGVLPSRIMMCEVAVSRAELAKATELAEGLIEEVLDTDETQHLVSGFDVVAHLALASGDSERAAAILDELEGLPSIRDSWNYMTYLPELVRLAIVATGLEFAERLASDLPDTSLELHRLSLQMASAELAEARGEPARAAGLFASAEDAWRTFSVPERAQALLGSGRCLLELGDPDAGAVLRESLEVFGALKAQRFLPEVDTLIERAIRLSS